MNNRNLYTSLLFLWAGLSTVFLLRSCFNNKPTSLTKIDELNHKIDSISVVNKTLDSCINTEKNRTATFKKAIDSINSLKPQIINKYVYKYKEIDNASIGLVINNFDSIFSKNNIK